MPTLCRARRESRAVSMTSPRVQVATLASTSRTKVNRRGRPPLGDRKPFRLTDLRPFAMQQVQKFQRTAIWNKVCVVFGDGVGLNHKNRGGTPNLEKKRMFWIIGWMFFGLIVGAIARAVYPGRQPMGWFKTMFLGIGGSLLGGFVGYLLAGGSMVQGAGWIGSLLGAVALIAISQRRHRIDQQPSV